MSLVDIFCRPLCDFKVTNIVPNFNDLSVFLAFFIPYRAENADFARYFLFIALFILI